MANKTISTQSATIRVKVGAAAFVKLGGIVSFSGLGGGSGTVIDSTDLDSTAREKLMGLADEGTFTVNCNYHDDDVGQVALMTARADRSLVSFELKLPGITQVYKWDGFVQTGETSGGVDAKVERAFAIEITGSVTRGTAAV